MAQNIAVVRKPANSLTAQAAVSRAAGAAVDALPQALEQLETRTLFSGGGVEYEADPNLSLPRHRPILTADFDGDGRDDVLAVYADEFTFEGDTLDVRVFRAPSDPGGSTFVPGANLSAWQPDNGKYLVGDLNGNGRDELIVARTDAGAEALVFDLSTATPNLIRTIPLGNVTGDAGVQLGDFDGDGDLDLVAREGTNAGTSGLRLYINDGDGEFTKGALRVSEGAPDPADAAVADLNGDGRDELIWTAIDGDDLARHIDFASTLAVIGSGGTGGGFLFPAAAVEGRAVTVDFDGDGREAVLVLGDDGGLTVLELNGSGALVRSDWSVTTGENGTAGAIAATSHPDAAGTVAALTYDQSVVYVGAGADGRTTILGRSNFAVAGTYDHAAFGDINGDGRADLIASREVPSFFGTYPVMSVQIGLDAATIDFLVSGGAFTGGQLFFDADPSGELPPGDVTWNFGDGSTAEGPFVTHRFARPGQYEVTRTFVSEAGQARVKTRYVTIKNPSAAAPKARFSARPDDLEGTFNASGSTGQGLTFAWDFGDGTTADGQRVSYSFAEAGEYAVTLTVTDAFLRTSTMSRTVRVGPDAPDVTRPLGPQASKATAGEEAELSFDVAAAALDAAEHNNLGNLDGKLTYLIDWHDGTTTSGSVNGGGIASLQRQFAESGDQPYTLLLKDEAGGEAVVKGKIDVADDPARPVPQPTVSRGVLEVRGTGGDDVIEIRAVDRTQIEVFVNGESNGIHSARTLKINAGGGNDVVDLSGLSSTHYARAEVMGGWGDDSLYGGGGNDELYGMLGNDRVVGNGGDDLLEGSAGDDTLVGGRGDDTLIGGRGNDTADYSENTVGMPVDATLDSRVVSHDGVGGKDRISSSTENLLGGDGDDRLTGNDHGNWLAGNGGNDSLFGNGGTNRLDGGDGDDILWGGGEGTSTIFAGLGNDAARVGSNDTIEGDEPERRFENMLDLAA